MSIKTLQELKKEAIDKKLHYEEENPSSREECEFLSCGEPSVLYLEDFHVCIKHGLRLIQCLTDKLSYDTVDPDLTE